MGTALPIGRLVRRAAVATAATAALVLVTCPWDTPWFDLIAPGRDGPVADVLRADFPDGELWEYEGHDGQQFYVVARDPWHLREVGTHLDRPRYRLQRPLLSWLAWALHPTGGGPGLVVALFVVGVAALVTGGVACGVIAVTLRGPPWAAAVFPLLGGAWWSLRISVADALSVALALAAIACALRSRHRLAVLAGAGAVLAKEVALVMLVGYALWRRRRDVIPLVAVPLAAGAAWALVLRLSVPAGSRIEWSSPFHGVPHAVGVWLDGEGPISAFWVLLGIALAVVALARRGLRHPLGWVVALQLPVLAFVANFVPGNPNGPRYALPLTAAAVLMVLTPDWRTALDEGAAEADERGVGAATPAAAG